MTRLGWFHCLAGASGDMVLGALVDAGVDLDVMQRAVDALGVERITLSAERVDRGGLAATKVDVHVERSTVIRTWPHIRGLLENAPLDEAVRRTALEVFQRLADAEAQIHHSTPELVRFHEIGALDALADIVGAAAGLHALDLDVVAASPVATGVGMARSEHGALPVPTPAVLELLKGAPIYSGAVPAELCTPTGAALLAATVTEWGDLPMLRVSSVGYGAGTREFDDLPNVLRIVVGERVAADGPAGYDALVVEANVDDLDPRLWPDVISAVIAAGAADAWLTPIHMKKGRPAVTVSVLVDPAKADAARDALFRQTSTIGMREYGVRKRALDRAVETVTLADGSELRVKVAYLNGEVVNATPEYDDALAVATQTGRPVKLVLAEAAALAARRSAEDADDTDDRA
ncbi:MAG: nickel pincer cofactor biosynthesis protein LarC [Mycobacteriales bacterium]|nr:nickel pincer cofactor biosynthesis protein LarC [Frankia sp.]